MEQERYVAAIEIGSSKIIAVAGRYNSNGQLTVIATEKDVIKESVRYGMILNLEETAMRVSRLIEKLQRHQEVSPRKITGVFVGLSGRSLRSVSTDVHLSLPQETDITQEIVDRLRKDALQTAIDNTLTVIDAIPRVYKIGKYETTSPVGVSGSEISVTYDIIVCRPELKRNIQRVIEDKCGLKVEGFVVTSLAAAHLIISGEEKRLGCMLVDMGAETTTVSIYHKGSLCYYATIPLGGRNITRDLTSLSLIEERAEEIKISSGNAVARDTPSSINLNGIRLSDVNAYIVARSEEIVANIVEQISYAGLKEKDIPGGIICIGGGIRLNGMIELINRQSGLVTKAGRLPDYIHTKGANAAQADTIAIDCILYEGASVSDASCMEIPRREELPATGELPPADQAIEEAEESESQSREKSGGWMSKFSVKLQSRLSQLFKEPVEDESDLYDE